MSNVRWLRIWIVSAFTLMGAQPCQGNVQAALKEGWWAYERGDLNGALRIYREVADCNPEDPTVQYDLGGVYAAQGDYRMAQESLLKAVELDPHLAAAYDALAQVYEQQEQFWVALTLYRAAAELEPRNSKFNQHWSRAQYQRGVLELQTGNIDTALETFQAVLERSPGDVAVLNGIGLCHLRFGQYRLAADVFQRAQDLDPENPTIQTNLGVAAAYEQRWGDAKSAWEQALKLNPQFGPANANLERLHSAERKASE